MTRTALGMCVHTMEDDIMLTDIAVAQLWRGYEHRLSRVHNLLHCASC